MGFDLDDDDRVYTKRELRRSRLLYGAAFALLVMIGAGSWLYHVFGFPFLAVLGGLGVVALGLVAYLARCFCELEKETRVDD